MRGERSLRKCLFVLVFLSALSIYLGALALTGRLNLPPEPGDGPDYDQLAFQLWRGKGFSFEYGDKEYLRPYSFSEEYRELFQESPEYRLTAYRPPLFPFVIFLLYSIFGRSFAAVRIFNCACLSLAAAAGAYVISERYRVLGAVIFSSLFVFSSQIFMYSYLFLTEPISVLLTTLLFALIIQYKRDQKMMSLVMIGIIAGVNFLNRSINLFYLPVIAVLLPFWTRNIKSALLSCSITALIIAPWAIRNCVVLNDFMPFGTEGAIGMPDAYSDLIIKNLGMWSPEMKEALVKNQRSQYSGLEFEKYQAEIGMRTGLEWIRHNLHKLPIVFGIKVLREYLRKNVFFDLMWIFVFLGLWVYKGKPDFWIYAAFLFVNVISVGLTWSLGGRLLVPVLPVVFLLLTTFLIEFARSVFEPFKAARREQRSAREEVHGSQSTVMD